MGQTVFPGRYIGWATMEQLNKLASLVPANVTVNLGGELIDRSPEEIAAFVLDGGIWSDYCPTPMYYQEGPGMSPLAAGFVRFLEALGAPTNFTFASFEYNPDFPRALTLLDGPPKGFVANKDAPHTRDPVPIYSSFAIRAGKGVYFYAYDAHDFVTPEAYASFIIDTLKKPQIPLWLLPLGIGTVLGGIFLKSRQK